MLMRLALMAVFSGAMAMPALACSILPPQPPPALAPVQGESPDEYQARLNLHLDGFQALQQAKAREEEKRQQSAVLGASAAVAVVEVKAIQRDLKTTDGMGIGSGVDLKVVGWLKGKGKPKTLRLVQTSYTSCGPGPAWDVFAGAPGQRFLTFFETGAATQDDTRQAMAVSRIIDPSLVEMLAAKVR